MHRKDADGMAVSTLFTPVCPNIYGNNFYRWWGQFIGPHSHVRQPNDLSRLLTKTNNEHPAKTQISLGIHPV